jgi:hypothetical protein
MDKNIDFIIKKYSFLAKIVVILAFSLVLIGWFL